MIQIIPAVLSTSENDYIRDISRYKLAESLKGGWLHIDFMDNKFVPNLSIPPSVSAEYPIELHKEAHLMVLDPMEWIDDLSGVGFERIIFHIESSDDTLKCIEYIKGKGLEVGLAINGETPIEKLEPFVSKIDAVLVMTIAAGFQGQPFIPKALNKVKEIKSKNWPLRVGVDGAVKDTTIREIMDTGADFAIVGSYLLNGDIEENLETLWEATR